MVRVLATTFALVALSATTVTGQNQPPRTTWTFAAVGDVIMNRLIMQYDNEADPAFQQLVRIIREADVSFMNLEQSVFDLASFEGWPAAETGGSYELASPATLRELADMGFDLLNRANNHTTDWGVEGMRATNGLLDAMGLVHAGTGENLGLASRPGYLETRAGRIALIGMASTHTSLSRAGSQGVAVRGRPGVNPLRLNTMHYGSPQTMAELRRVATQLSVRQVDPDGGLSVFGTIVHAAARDTTIVTLNERDRRRVLHEVRNAASLSDFVVATSHTHEPSNHSMVPPDWLVRFAREAVDEGAALFVGHGPHQLRGVEIHNGRPVFYSLGNFIFQNETIDPMPMDETEIYGLPFDALASEVYDARFQVDSAGNPTWGFPTESRFYESVVAVVHFEGDEVTEMRFYPVELGWQEPRSRRGTPRLADDTTGRKIVERLAELSRPFGVVISWEKDPNSSRGIGVWRR
ncbi:MAG: CapA family protein [Acidimicrobiia bacterium]|nr:CapA family protein [Acidimicrobiia bacterium]